MQASTCILTHDEKSVNYRSVYVFMSAFNMTNIVVCACTDDTLHSNCSLHCVVTSSFLFQLLGLALFGSVGSPETKVGQLSYQNKV